MTGTATDAFPVFGTTAVLVVTDEAALADARSIADAELAAVDRACSRFRPDSELSRLNQSSGELTPVSELFAALIAEALRAAELTGGDVDPTCGQALVSAGYDRDFAELATGADAAARPAGPVPGWRSVRLDETGPAVRLDRGAQLDLGSTAKAWAADHAAVRRPGDVERHGQDVGVRRPDAAPHHRPADRRAGPVVLAHGQRRGRDLCGREHREHGV